MSKKLLGVLLVGAAVAGLLALYREKLTPLVTMAKEKLDDTLCGVKEPEETEDTTWGFKEGEGDVRG